MISELEDWLKDNHITYQLRRNDIVFIPGFGKCLFQSMKKREHLFRQDKDSKEVHFSCVENYEFLRNDDVFYVIVKFGDCFYYFDIRDDKEELHILKYVGEFTGSQIGCAYYPLGVHTGFELLNGSGSLANWCKKAKFLGYKGIAVCDKNTLASSLELQRESASAGLKFCFGYSLTFTVGDDNIEAKIYSQTQEGFDNLLRIQYHINVLREGDRLIDLTDLCALAKGNVMVIGKLNGEWLADPDAEAALNTLLSSFEKVYYQVDCSEYKADRIDSQILLSIKAYFDAFYISPTKYRMGINPVLIQDVYYADKGDSRNKIVLNKIDTGAAHGQSDCQYMKTLDELYDEFDALFSEKYSEEVFFHMCENTARILECADAAYDLSENYMPRYEMTDAERDKYGTNLNMFLQLLEEGFKNMVPEGEEEKYRERLDYEIDVLMETDSVDYFLIQYDTVNWARKNDILVGIGRGSAGGSLALYLMGITKIDPIQYQLLFERFLLPERAGLESKELTVIEDNVESSDYVEMTLENGKTYRFDRDAEFLVKRDGQEIIVYADELLPDDDIIFDNKNLIFTI